jgi:hypothetical protein
MRVRLAVAFFVSSALAWPSFAQTIQRHPLQSSATRVGQLSQEVVAQLLSQHGFSDVTNLRLEAGIYRAEATKSGTRVSIEMDAFSGRLLKP